ncbi:preprotein translocase subunit YajC [Mycobacterium camsae]|uniref:preprotein translocase subunit YajC n=1 Tax=Mycobacterium gordonae TaxID=1778 RepID=UPI00197FEDF1|nr:preprotein translocase subunit YajC [Mycobacterium gordonae]
MESFVLFLPFLLIMGGFMYFASRRQRKAMQATIDLHESLQPGDRVHTTSGLEATVVSFTDDTVDLEIAPGVVTTWMKLAVRDRILPDDDEDYEVESTAYEAGEDEATDSESGRVVKDS